MRVLFITNGSIGDVIMATGLLAHLIDTYPSARFTIVASPAAAPLFVAVPRLERIITLTKRSYNRHWLELWWQVVRSRWDLVIDLRGSALGFMVLTRQRRIFHNANKALHKRDQLAALLGLNPTPAPRLWVSAEAEEKVRALLPTQDYVVFVPKSNASFKDWPLENFTELARRLHTYPEFSNSLFVVTGLSSQAAYLVPLVASMADYGMDIAGKTDLPMALALLKHARLVVAVDSGLLHITAVLGTPVVGLYGPTNDKVYAPTGDNVSLATVRDFAMGEKEIIDPDIIKELSVDGVEAAIKRLMPRIKRCA